MSTTIARIAMRFFLHGWGSSAEQFRANWPDAWLQPPSLCLFLDGIEHEPLTGLRRWFPFSGVEDTLARYLDERAVGIEDRIQYELQASGLGTNSPIGVVGHSQGGMIAMTLALRGRLNIVDVDSYAAFLPALERPLALSSATDAATVRLHASCADEYVPFHRVQKTVEYLRQAGLRHVELISTHGRSHAFSDAWLGESATWEQHHDA